MVRRAADRVGSDWASAGAASRTMACLGLPHGPLGPRGLGAAPSGSTWAWPRVSPRQVRTASMKQYDNYLGWMYRGGRPNRFARLQNRGTAVAFAAGILPKRAAALEIRGRRSGRVISFPVAIADFEGERYLVSMLGRTRTGCATSRLRTARLCCVMAVARPCASRKLTRAPALRSCGATSRSHLASGLLSQSAGRVPSQSSGGSPRNTRCSASAPMQPDIGAATPRGCDRRRHESTLATGW